MMRDSHQRTSLTVTEDADLADIEGLRGISYECLGGRLRRLLSVGDIREERPELWIAFWAVVAVLFAAGFIVPRNRGTDG